MTLTQPIASKRLIFGAQEFDILKRGVDWRKLGKRMAEVGLIGSRQSAALSDSRNLCASVDFLSLVCLFVCQSYSPSSLTSSREKSKMN